MRVAQWVAAFTALAVVVSPMALAKNNKGHGPGNQARAKSEQGPPPHAGGSFSSGDINLVRAVFVGYPSYRGAPLPPGIAKNFARGKPLPPGIAKKVVPPELLVRLPTRPGYTYYIVEDDVVLVSITGIVIDIIVDVFG